MDQVVFSITFTIAHPDNRVEYDLWYTSSDDRALDFILDFYDYNKGLGRDVEFTPRFVYWECERCDQEILSKHCWSKGKYCAIDSTNDKHTGREIMLEDLREKCIDAIYSSEHWWKYMSYVHRVCASYIG